MAESRLAEMTRVKKSGRTLNRFGRLSQHDLLRDWMQDVRGTEETKAVPVILASVPEPHEILSCSDCQENIFPIFISWFLTLLSSSHIPFPASAAASLL